jgi:hypothetical protein
MEKREISMKVGQVLHMNGGTGHTSYSNNSLLQVLKKIVTFFFEGKKKL